MITIYINSSKYQKEISKCIRYLYSSRALQMHPQHKFPQESLGCSCSHSLHLFPQGVKGEAEQINASVKCLQISLFRFTQTIPNNQKQNRRKCSAAEIFSLFNFMQIFFLKINVCAGKSKKKSFLATGEKENENRQEYGESQVLFCNLFVLFFCLKTFQWAWHRAQPTNS